MILSKYFEILEENTPARYQNCKYVPVEFDVADPLNDLWEKHDAALKNIKLSDVQPEKSLLDLKIEIASRIFQNCCFCERRCGIDRNRQSGNCGVKQSLIASEFLHFGEESVLVPSHTIFFSGCTFHCVFCQNWDISQQNVGFYIDPSKLCEVIGERYAQGSKNVNWVGGDPTPNLLYILETLKLLDVNIPQVWNSNMYCSVETMKLLDGVVDLYLTDFKYGNDKCAKVFSKVDNYFDIVELKSKGRTTLRAHFNNCCKKQSYNKSQSRRSHIYCKPVMWHIRSCKGSHQYTNDKPPHNHLCQSPRTIKCTDYRCFYVFCCPFKIIQSFFDIIYY